MHKHFTFEAYSIQNTLLNRFSACLRKESFIFAKNTTHGVTPLITHPIPGRNGRMEYALS